ncbi:cupin domain-containing protein [Vineibacter terrae]|uniref:hypothetical protein n=1 Tax=Vineibacter terrae TaxID=2586908 RepID=UPI001C4990B2|nr:hypothetical protein [Vineibacter terrae]
MPEVSQVLDRQRHAAAVIRDDRRGAEPVLAPVDQNRRLYVALDGEVMVSNGRDTVRQQRWDSCRIAPHEGHQRRNDTDHPASILLVMPLPTKPGS